MKSTMAKVKQTSKNNAPYHRDDMVMMNDYTKNISYPVHQPGNGK